MISINRAERSTWPKRTDLLATINSATAYAAGGTPDLAAFSSLESSLDQILLSSVYDLREQAKTRMTAGKTVSGCDYLPISKVLI